MAMDSTAITVQAQQEAVPVTMARRIAALGWFLAHCIAVAVLTAVGAVVALAAVTLFCLAAPVAGLAFATAMHRHDLRRLPASA
jgi:hypothetical protein